MKPKGPWSRHLNIHGRWMGCGHMCDLVNPPPPTRAVVNAIAIVWAKWSELFQDVEFVSDHNNPPLFPKDFTGPATHYLIGRLGLNLIKEVGARMRCGTQGREALPIRSRMRFSNQEAFVNYGAPNLSRDSFR
ncbi:hypothetical protein J6590_018059 [Homalodisca vitripennis]|nr:hypothetical protein J6590_018059 [Homalodisca vitripennis]